MSDPADDAPEKPASLEKRADAASPERTTDVVFVHGAPTEGVQITRLRDDRIESGELRPLREGRPIVGEVVKLAPRKESDRLFDVEVLAKGATPPAEPRDKGHKGPTRVTSSAFRDNWDTVFASGRSKKNELPS